MLMLQFIYILKGDYILCLKLYPQNPPGDERRLGTTPCSEVLKFLCHFLRQSFKHS